MSKTIEQKQRDNYELLFSTIKNLSTSQGFYGRLFQQLINMSEKEQRELISELPTFNNSVDVVMWLEQ